MANATVNPVGSVNGSGATDALFLKVFGGEVITAFEQLCKMKDRVQKRSISSGKSAQFPRYGRISAQYHTPGTEIVGTTQNWAEAVITIDDLLLSDAFIANIDEAKSHYDVRSPISTEMGRALANAWDKQLLQMAVIGARSANPVSGLEGGAQILTSNVQAPASADFMNNGGHLASALFLAAQAMDNSYVPEDGRAAFVRPAQYFALASTVNNINKLWGGQGAYSDGTVLKIAGFEIVKTVHLPTSAVATGTVDAGFGPSGRSPYAVDASATAAICMHNTALGTVQLLDLALESDYDIRRQGTLMVAKYAVGHGVLRPESLVEIKNAAS
jgi:hypothetical protein